VTPGELCRVLLVGPVPAAAVPELSDDGVRAEVRRRLDEAGCELAYSVDADRWVARLAGPVPDLEGHERLLQLGQTELAVLAACWLHLRFLPAEHAPWDADASDAGGEDAALDPDDLARQLQGRLGRDQLDDLLDRLRRSGFLTRRDGLLHAGPLLGTLEDPAVAEQARALLTRHRRLAHLRRQAASNRPRGADGEDRHATD
jgi:hypothetical protein